MTTAKETQTDTFTIRPFTPGDLATCAPILYEAFRSLAERHHFPPDFPSPEVAAGLLGMFAGHPRIYGFVAESAGRPIGSNFLFHKDEIAAVGPITVDPVSQRQGVGRALMRAVLEQGRDARGIRLVQDAFNTASMSLYTSLGFDAREPLALLTGKPVDPPPADVDGRPLRREDLPACSALCRGIHGIDRTEELAGMLGGPFTPRGVFRGGRLTAYASAPTCWPLNHAVAETEEDLKALLLSSAAAEVEPLAFLLPIRQSALFRWCLAQGLRVVKPMTLMTMGYYQEPRGGAWYPSVMY